MYRHRSHYTVDLHRSFHDTETTCIRRCFARAARLFAPGAGAPTAPFDSLDSTPEKFPGGIKVDATFAASGSGVEPKSVYAIGDIAAFPLSSDGGKLVRMAGYPLLVLFSGI